MRNFALLPLILLAACSSEERSAGGVTPNEARALEEAAEMLQDKRLPAGAVPQGQGTPSVQPAPKPQPTTKPAG
ncbi:MAG: hypothetical protein ABL914_02660 [Novosphingobium sp.]|uniref:hypothetical protein n=1 Tax=Novosphingobium sp. TaxID=1874826 RepID=UPI0032BA0FE5